MRYPSRVSTRTLSSCLALSLASGSVAAFANVLVTTCDDHGPGSLRDAVAAAADGATVDMTALTCSSISLQTGTIAINQRLLKLEGPGRHALTINAKYANRAFDHSAGTDLTIKGVAIAGGWDQQESASAAGGCILAGGNVTLDNVDVSHCLAKSTSGAASGGAIRAAGAVRMLYSTISQSTAQSGVYNAHGGAVYAAGGLFMYGSTLSGNTVLAGPGAVPGGFRNGAAGGAAYFGGDSRVAYSTISGNRSSGVAGGLNAVADNFLFENVFTLDNSTISGNDAGDRVGGIYSIVSMKIRNSTIADNTANSGTVGPDSFAPGISVVGFSTSAYVSLSGVLSANNVFGSSHTENDFDGRNVAVLGDRNLIRASTTSLPGNNLTGMCPLLGPLRNNGGPTLTHALLSHSPAIDAALGITSGTTDQRGSGYSRHSGPGGVTDIGAYELQQNDAVFAAGFDGCGPLR